MTDKTYLPDDVITSKIFLIRNQKVMLDSDLAQLYQVDTRRLNEQVKRNLNRFPDDFMFQLTVDEWNNLKSQNATSSWGGRRKLPYAFTEHGVLMLSSVLKSDRAAAVNIQIMWIYVQFREVLRNNSELYERLEEMENRISENEGRTESVFNYLKQFIHQQGKNRKKIGFKTSENHS